MSITIMSTVFAIKGQLTASEKLILLELSDHANDQGYGIWPSMDTIQSRTSFGSMHTVRDLLGFLTAAGILVTTEEATAHSSTKRRISVAMLEELRLAGEEGRRHAGLLQARQEWKLLQDQARGAPSAPQEKTVRGAPSAPQRGTYCPPEGHSLPPRGAPSAPESLLKHPLTIIETEGPPKNEKIPASECWEMIRGQLADEMASHNFSRYIQPASAIGWRDDLLLVGLPDEYASNWCQSRLGRTAARLASAFAGQTVTVKFVESTA